MYTILSATIVDYTSPYGKPPEGEEYAMTIELLHNPNSDDYFIRYSDNMNGDGDSVSYRAFTDAREIWATEVRNTIAAVSNPPY